MLRVYNSRILKISQYWISAPLGYWWDGRRFMKLPNCNRFVKGKFKGVSSLAFVEVKDFERVMRLANICRFKSGEHKKIGYSMVEVFPYRYGKTNRLISDYY